MRDELYPWSVHKQPNGSGQLAAQVFYDGHHVLNASDAAAAMTTAERLNKLNIRIIGAVGSPAYRQQISSLKKLFGAK
jgi:hypothetical protein